MTQNRFNLIDEAWLPIESRGPMSLSEIFKDPTIGNVAGSPVQKIALMKFLLALVQAAYTPETENGWLAMSSVGLANKVLHYLDQHKDLFWLYGDKPFLQMTTVDKAQVQPYGALNPEIAAGNTTVLNNFQIARELTDAEKACLLLRLQGFALGGKKTDNAVVLSPGYGGKKRTGGAGPCLGFLGYLHSFVLGECLWDTLRINLFTKADVDDLKVFTEGVGMAPWEGMPVGEDCPVARRLKHSFIGRLMPMNRFCLLANDGMHYTEGIQHDGYKEGMIDPSVSVCSVKKERKALWVNPNKRPWRSLTAQLSFLSATKGDNFFCPQLQVGIRHARDYETIKIWSGGLRVSSNAGEQYVAGDDDYVESVTSIRCSDIGDLWFQRFANEMEALETLGLLLYGSVKGYYTDLNVKDSPKAGQASNAFWQKAESLSIPMVEVCSEADVASRHRVRQAFFATASSIYDLYCPHETPRQISAWVNHRLYGTKYLSE